MSDATARLHSVGDVPGNDRQMSLLMLGTIFLAIAVVAWGTVLVAFFLFHWRSPWLLLILAGGAIARAHGLHCSRMASQ